MEFILLKFNSNCLAFHCFLSFSLPISGTSLGFGTDNNLWCVWSVYKLGLVDQYILSYGNFVHFKGLTCRVILEDNLHNTIYSYFNGNSSLLSSDSSFQLMMKKYSRCKSVWWFPLKLCIDGILAQRKKYPKYLASDSNQPTSDSKHTTRNPTPSCWSCPMRVVTTSLHNSWYLRSRNPFNVCNYTAPAWLSLTNEWKFDA